MSLLETLKLLRERELLVPRQGADGTWRLEPTVDIAAALVQEQSRHELLPPCVRTMIQARLAKLSPAARQVILARTVLCTRATAQWLWQVAELGVQAGIEALEEAVASGMLREEEAGGPVVGRPSSYHFTHELIRDVVYTELSEARRQVLHQRALVLAQTEGAPAATLAYHALASGETEVAARYSVQAGDEALAMFAVEDAIRHYEHARSLLQEHKPLQTVLSPPEIEHLYVCLGRAYAFQQAWQQAQQAYEELLAYAQWQLLPALASMTLNRLAVLVVQQSKDRSQVQALLEEAWHLAETGHDQRALAETEWNQAQIEAWAWDNPRCSLPYGEQALSLARGIQYKELEARSLSLLGWSHLRVGDFEEAIHCLEASLALYVRLSAAPSAAQELSLPSIAIGASPTQPLTNRATEALCWGELAFAQVHAGQVHDSIRSGRRALALAQESKNGWAYIYSTICLVNGLLDAGAYEEALVLMQDAVAQARTFPPTIIFQRSLIALGRTYQAVQQWKEAQATLEEAEALAGTLGLGALRVSALTQLCMHHALSGEWEAAYRYAVQAITVRKRSDVAVIVLDFYRQYETEALLRGGDGRQAQEAVYRLGERVGPNRRYRVPYLRSLATLAAWEGQSEQAISHLQEAAQLATDLELPGERWQIQATLASLYEAIGQQEQARTTFGEAATIIQGLAEGIKDEARRSRFLAGPQIQQVVQHAQGATCILPKSRP